MFAVICNPQYWKDIEGVIISRNEQILLKSVDNDVDIICEFEKIERVPIKYLIIDITSIQDSDDFLRVIRRYRIRHDTTQIIILAPNCIPGDESIHSLVTMGIYNIIAPSGETPEELAIPLTLNDVLDNPYSYKKAVRWVGYDDNYHLKEDVKAVNTSKTEIVSIKERIVGTITITVANLQHGSGSSHTALTIAKYLSAKGFRVAVVELKQTNDYGLIYLQTKSSYNQHSFKYETFDIYANDGEIHPDDLLINAMSKNYNYIVLDVGLLFEYDLKDAKLDKPSTKIKKYKKGFFYNDFMKADIKLINTFASSQFADSIEYLLNYLKIWDITDLKLLFNFTNEEILNGYRKCIDSKIFLLPYNTTFSLTKEQDEFYGGLLKNIVPKDGKMKGRINVGESIKNLFSKGISGK